MFLNKMNYNKKALLDKVVLLTGGGGGIGYEASRAFSYMGAKVIIAELDPERGLHAQRRINEEYQNNNVEFYQIDISNENQIDKLYQYMMDKYSHLDVMIHNAAVVPMGAIEKVSIADWDLSYLVNLRGPVLFTQKFLPSMKKTGGIIIFNPSATVTPYMSAYEIFKSAQVELCNTLFEEVAGTNIITYSIAPGFVKTETAIKAVEIVTSSLGMETEEFYKSLEEVILDVELAGVGYAVSVVHADQYNGQLTSSYQVLLENGLMIDNKIKPQNPHIQVDYDKLSSLLTTITNIFFDQYQNWQKKKLFQKQFILSDFKKQMGQSADRFNNHLEALLLQTQNHQWNTIMESKDIFLKLQHFYKHQKELLQSYEKNETQLANDTKLLNHWIELLQELIDML